MSEDEKRATCCGGFCAAMPSCQTGDEMIANGSPEEMPVVEYEPRWNVRYSAQFVQQARVISGDRRWPLRVADGE